ncbi:putative glycosyltransferase [Roseibacterium elongatum DSM 19469]|uniref:Putative glycosyltransferase n=1 Tax=Roseicyclus elongatus DSM 19469 TaxID=1294273 RepID=W8SM22_9RHOB|nr:glycosyltransferase [Roseibacterium elongatum]AHM03585.1 putative glycosyltransferase [Roseibacterium elongatum DSM 19469]
MKILFVHQNFPGQYRELFKWFVEQGDHEIVFLTQRTEVPHIKGARIVTYKPHHKPAKDAYALTQYWEECAGAGFGAAMAAQSMDKAGFKPDIILGHVGWGELTFMKEVWPDVPIIGFFEYYFLAKGGSVGFDPEFPASAHTPFVMHARNAVNFANIQTVDLGHSPTAWQRDTFPETFHDKIYVCHDGIRTDRLRPNPEASVPLGRLGRSVTRQDEIFTYMARNMEPTRGFHVFMRALPHILAARPNARALIIGGNEVSYGKASDRKGGYRADMEREVGDRVDWDRVHFLGRVPYEAYQQIIRISRCHIYLTVPFVLSWSLLESMSMGATIVASDVAPVREAVTHGKTGLLVDYFQPEKLAQQVADVLERPGTYAHLGPAARQHVIETYDFRTRTLPVHLARINDLLPRAKQVALP